MDICIPLEFGVKWKGRYLRPSTHAIKEMVKLGLDLHDVEHILEKGNECEGDRAKGTIERFVRHGRKITKVVAVGSYAFDIEEEVWLMKHVGGK